MRMVKNRQKKIVSVLLPVVLLTALVFLFIFLPLMDLTAKARAVNSLVRPAKEALLLQDLPKFKESLAAIDREMANLENAYRKFFYISLVPLLGAYYSDGRLLIGSSRNLIASAGLVVEDIIPYSAKLGFKGGNPEEPIVGGQDRLAGLVSIAPVLSRDYERIEKGIHAASLEIGKIDAGKYPKNVRGFTVRKNLEMLKSVVASLESSSKDIRSFLSEIPAILGDSKEVSYLILFQNDKEIRPTGGFLTAYAVFTLDRGRIISVRSGDMYFLDIDNRVPFYPAAPAVIQNYLKIKDWYIRDANLSPDFKESAIKVEEFWNRVPGVPKIDGIVAIDTHFVESLVGLLGDISVPGYEKFTRENITYQLEVYATVIGSKLEKRGGRKDLIGVLMQAMMQKAFSQSSKQYGKILTAVWQEAVEKHLLFYLHSDIAQNLAEKYNFAGRIDSFDGDYLHINDANFAGRKANWYVVEKINKKVERQGNKLISQVEINYENTGDYNPDFNTGYRDYVRVFVPLGSKLVGSIGSLNETEQFEELGKTVFASYIAVDPKKEARLVLKYELPEDLSESGKYKLLIQKQPGTGSFEYTVTIGRKTERFNLLEDRLVNGNL